MSDFSAYLDAKCNAIKKYDVLSYCGEEDLLAHYLLNYDAKGKRHIIGLKDGEYNSVMVGEGEWKDFVESEIYKKTKAANAVSYYWDHLVQKTCQNALNQTLGGNSNPFRGQSAICEMAKEPRFVRRELSKGCLKRFTIFRKHLVCSAICHLCRLFLLAPDTFTCRSHMINHSIMNVNIGPLGKVC